jgi:hypothetical protein
MTHFTYITTHLLPSWIRQWTYNFKHWADLMTNNYETYANVWSESPERECYEWFWSSINMDETLPKEFLEELYRRMDDVDTGKVKTVPAEDVLKRLKELVMEDD